MANFSAPNGASPVRYSNGAPWNGQCTAYFVPSTDNNAYYIGDFVKSTAGIETTLGTYAPYITKAAASNTLRGVIVGFDLPGPGSNGASFDPSLIYLPATKTRGYVVWVADDQNLIFEMTDDGLGTPTSAWVGKNANFTVAAPSSPSVNPLSATVIQASSVQTTSTLPLKIVGMRAVAGNSADDYGRWLVRINAHEFFGLTSGV